MIEIRALEQEIQQREEKLRLLEREHDDTRSVLVRLERGIEMDHVAVIQRRAALENPVLNTSAALQRFRTSVQRFLDEQPGGDHNTLFVHAVEILNNRMREQTSHAEMLREEIQELRREIIRLQSVGEPIQPGVDTAGSDDAQHIVTHLTDGVGTAPRTGNGALFRTSLDRNLSEFGADRECAKSEFGGHFGR